MRFLSRNSFRVIAVMFLFHSFAPRHRKPRSHSNPFYSCRTLYRFRCLPPLSALSQDIHEELDLQSNLLSEIDSGVDKTTRGLKTQVRCQMRHKYNTINSEHFNHHFGISGRGSHTRFPCLKNVENSGRNAPIFSSCDSVSSAHRRPRRPSNSSSTRAAAAASASSSSSSASLSC